MDYEVMDFFRSKVSTSVRRKQSCKSTQMNIRTKLNHFQNQALYSHQFNMMHCESESCYSGHCNVKSGDFELDYDGIYNYPEYDDYAMDYNYTCGVQKGKRRDCEF